MCGGGKNDDAPTSPARSIELTTRTNHPSTSQRPATSQRPGTRQRPTTNQTPATSQRPRTSQRPTTNQGLATSRREQPRPTTSNNSTRPPLTRPPTTRHPNTADGSRRKSSHQDRPGSSHRLKTSDGTLRNRFPNAEEHTADKTIIRNFRVLNAFIEQHVENFFPRNGSSSQERQEFNDPHTRHARIRQYLAQKYISHTVEHDGDRSAIVSEIFEYLAPYSSANNNQRENHLFDLYRLGSRLREAIGNHTAVWTFDFSSADRYIAMVPALMRDGEEVVPSQMFKIS